MTIEQTTDARGTVSDDEEDKNDEVYWACTRLLPIIQNGDKGVFFCNRNAILCTGVMWFWATLTSKCQYLIAPQMM